MTSTYWAIALFWLGGGADIMTTYIAIVENKGFEEKNPIARWLLSRSSNSAVDFLVMLALKAAVFGVFVYFNLHWTAYLVAGLGQVYVAYRNYRLLKSKGIL